jgi:hypothetical protein
MTGGEEEGGFARVRREPAAAAENPQSDRTLVHAGSSGAVRQQPSGTEYPHDQIDVEDFWRIPIPGVGRMTSV